MARDCRNEHLVNTMNEDAHGTITMEMEEMNVQHWEQRRMRKDQ